MKILKYILLTIALIGLVACGGSSSPSNKAPTVNAGKDVTVERNKEVTLKGTAKDSDGTIKSYVWKNGSKVLSKKASFKYVSTKVGKETLTLTVTDDDGAMASDKVVVDVTMRAFITKWKVIEDKWDIHSKMITIPTYKNLKYNYSIDWGDGKTDSSIGGDITHAYAKNGEYTVKIVGQFPQIFFNEDYETVTKLRSVEQWGDIEWLSMSHAFEGCAYLGITAEDTPNLSKVIDMSYMFAGAFNGYYHDYKNMDNWDVSNIRNMSYLFAGRVKMDEGLDAYENEFNQDIGGWDVSNVRYMEGMFKLSSFNQDITGWDVSNVRNMISMFAGEAIYDIDGRDIYTSFNQDISTWDVSNVTSMYNMFNNYSNLSTLNYDSILNGWSLLSLKNGVNLGAGKTKYSKDAKESRDLIISKFNWTIIDGGMVE